MKLMPASSARFTIGRLAFSSSTHSRQDGCPTPIAPNPRRDTFRFVAPSLAYCIGQSFAGSAFTALSHDCGAPSRAATRPARSAVSQPRPVAGAVRDRFQGSRSFAVRPDPGLGGCATSARRRAHPQSAAPITRLRARLRAGAAPCRHGRSGRIGRKTNVSGLPGIAGSMRSLRGVIGRSHWAHIGTRHITAC